MQWISESPPQWDDKKAEILGASPAGVFRVAEAKAGDLLPGDWWRVEIDGEVVGYGWMDVTWGYAPVLVAVAPSARDKGVGSFIMDQLAAEAHKQGLAYIFNVIPVAHPDPKGLSSWLQGRGFEPSSSDDRMLRRQVNRT